MQVMKDRKSPSKQSARLKVVGGNPRQLTLQFVAALDWGCGMVAEYVGKGHGSEFFVHGQ